MGIVHKASGASGIAMVSSGAKYQTQRAHYQNPVFCPRNFCTLALLGKEAALTPKRHLPIICS